MNNSRGNESAFSTSPTFDSDGRTCDSGNTGLSIREYYAGLAMSGIMANADLAPIHDFESAAARAVEMADALIEALNKPKT